MRDCECVRSHDIVIAVDFDLYIIGSASGGLLSSVFFLARWRLPSLTRTMSTLLKRSNLCYNGLKVHEYYQQTGEIRRRGPRVVTENGKTSSSDLKTDIESEYARYETSSMTLSHRQCMEITYFPHAYILAWCEHLVIPAITRRPTKNQTKIIMAYTR